MSTRFKWLFLILLFAAPAFAQNVRVDNVTFSSVQGFPFLPGATITVCTAAASGLPCSPTVAGTCLSISDTTCNQSSTITADAFGNYGFWIQPGSYSYTVTKAGFGGFGPRALTLACQPTAACTITAPQTINSNLTVSGTGQFKNLQNIRMADQFTGADCGAKINAADADLGATAGQIWVNQNCGTAWTTTFTLSANHYLVFIQPGTYLSSACTNTLKKRSGITSMTQQAIGIGTDQAPVVFGEGSGANCAKFIDATDAFEFLGNVIFDGGKAANPSAQDILVIENNAQQGAISGATFQNATRHGINFNGTTGITSTTCCWVLTTVDAVLNGGDGIFCQGSNDIGIRSYSQIMNNGTDGIELSNCPGVRITDSEISGNNTTGGNASIEIYGTTTGLGSNNINIENNNMGVNVHHDILITGYDTVGGGYTSQANVISGNKFIAGVTPGRGANNTYDIIKLVDGGLNVISSNVMVTAASPHASRAAFEVSETASGRANTNTVGLNYPNGPFGTAIYIDSTSGGATGFQVPTKGLGATASFDLFDITTGASTPHKFFRVNGGSLQILNSLNNVVLTNLSDSGGFTLSQAGQPSQLTEGPAPTGTAGIDACQGNSTLHMMECSYNNNSNGVTTFFPVPQTGNTAGTHSDSGFYQTATAAGCTTAASIGGICATAITITWPVAFSDANYKVTCTPSGSPTNLPSNPFVVTPIAASITINYYAITAAAASWPNVACTAVHN